MRWLGADSPTVVFSEFGLFVAMGHWSNHAGDSIEKESSLLDLARSL